MSSSDPLILREALDADGPALSAIIAAIFAEHQGCLFLAEEFPEFAAVASHYAGRGGRLWVVEDAGAIVASFAVAPGFEPGTAEFFKVYCAASHRGRGIAHRLLAMAFAYCRECGFTAVSLWSDTKFVDGHRFYQRQGFLRQPGLRALHDASATLEFNFRLDPIPSPAASGPAR